MRSSTSLIARIKGQLVLVAILALLALALSVFGGNSHRISLSPEVKFTDSSAGGLRIVPASCPSAPHFVGECDSVPCSASSAPGACQCPAGYRSTAAGGRAICIPECSGSGCAPSGGCPTGYVFDRSQCVFSGCPAGYTLSGTQCVANRCSDSYACRGDDLYHTDANCNAAFVESCAFGCGGSSCLGPPSPEFTPFDATSPSGGFRASGHLQVHPTLVKSGDTSQVYWNVSKVSDCTVTGTNGDSWTGPFSGTAGKTTGHISNQVTYTLTCYYLSRSSSDGVGGPRGAQAFSEQATVNVVPFFQEK